MAFKPVSTTAIDIKNMEGKAVVGTYTGSKKITTQHGEQVIWQFLDEDEAPFGIYGFTNLNRAMEMIKPGSLCRVTYKGTQVCQTKFGKKPVHQVLVEVDDQSEAQGYTPGDDAEVVHAAKPAASTGGRTAGEKMPWDDEG